MRRITLRITTDGKTVRDWAEEHGFSENTVHKVISALEAGPAELPDLQYKGLYGEMFGVVRDALIADGYHPGQDGKYTREL